MITNAPLGGRQIVYFPRLTKSVVHDPWPDHGELLSSFFVQGTLSGVFYPTLRFRLKNGIEYWYFYTPGSAYDPAYAVTILFQTYVNPDGLVGYFGEWFNYVGKGLPFQKVSADNVGEFINS